MLNIFDTFPCIIKPFSLYDIHNKAKEIEADYYNYYYLDAGKETF